jgi:DNA polymerase-3 subunit alpha
MLCLTLLTAQIIRRERISMCETKHHYTSLHNHSPFSIDGFGPYETMIKRAAELNIKSFAITDHGTVAGIPLHYELCQKYNVKPIFGVEAYLVLDKNAQKIKTHHITLLARNRIGYENLIGLNNLAHSQMIQKGAIKFPVLQLSDLKSYRDGMIALTGCPASMIYYPEYDLAYGYVKALTRIYGEEHTFAEIMFSLDGQDFHTRPQQIAAELGIETVITNDTHYTYAEDATLQMDCNEIRARARSGKGYRYDSSLLYLQSAEELFDKAQDIIGTEATERAWVNMDTISNMVEDIDIRGEPTLPSVEHYEIADMQNYLQEQLEAYKLKYPQRAEIAQKRFETEDKIVSDFGFYDYFYIVSDIAKFVRDNGRYVTARGSASGSFIVYLLGICQADPLVYGLLFERFLNIARADYPDIDLDIDRSFRDEVIKYCEETWGLLPVSTIITFGHKSLVKDLQKPHKIDPDVANDLANADPDGQFFADYCNEHPDFGRAYNMMIGQPKGIGRHAAAVVSVNTELPLPVENWGNEPTIAYSESGLQKTISFIGGVKVDILSISALEILRRLYDITGVLPPEDIDSDFPSDVFCNGNTLGIFQFDGSAGIRDMCIDVQPHNLEDLAVINSMFRPGALDAGTPEHYNEYKLKPRKFDPRIDPILAPTASVIVFQEQVMQIYAVVTGEGLEGADIARRVLSPKSVKKLDDPKWKKQASQVKEEFFKKGKDNNFKTAVIEQLWDELITHSRYSFNKSHSIAYALLAAQEAWYKMRYPTAFYLANLNTLLDKGDHEKMQGYILAMVREGVVVKPPSVIHSSTIFEMKDNEIYLPITVVKYVSDRSLEALTFLKTYIRKVKDYIETLRKYYLELEFGNNDEVTLELPELHIEPLPINGEEYYNQLFKKLTKHKVTEVTTESLALLSKSSVWNKRCKENLYLVGALDGVPGDLTKLVSDDILTRQVGTIEESIKFMNVTIPTPKVIEYERMAERKGYTFGIIMKKIKKQTRKGVPVTMYIMTDNAVLRVYNNKLSDLLEYLPIDVGMPVICSTNKWGYLQYYENGLPRIAKAY